VSKGGWVSTYGPERLGKNRIETLSDGVFAIVVTLLVLELRIPELSDAASTAELSRELIAMAPKFLSMVMSFLTVCVIWLNHHRLFTLIEHFDVPLFWLNANLLLWVCVIPFPTAVVGDYPFNALALSLYGVVMSLMGCAFVFMRLHIQSARCVHEDVDLDAFRVATIRVVLLSPVTYAVGALVSWLWPPLAFAIYIGVPIYFVLPHAVRARGE
jgi:uncharacterized membrane protein